MGYRGSKNGFYHHKEACPVMTEIDSALKPPGSISGAREVRGGESIVRANALESDLGEATGAQKWSLA